MGEGKTVHDGIESIKRDYVNVFVADSILWPGVQAVNFKFVPVQYNALVVNSVCVGWNCFLSHTTHRRTHDDEETATEETKQTQEEEREMDLEMESKTKTASTLDMKIELITAAATA